MAERVVYKRSDGKWAWRLKVNGRVVATDGSQGYNNEADARNMADRIISGEFRNAEKKIIRPSYGDYSNYTQQVAEALFRLQGRS